MAVLTEAIKNSDSLEFFKLKIETGNLNIYPGYVELVFLLRLLNLGSQIDVLAVAYSGVWALYFTCRLLLLNPIRREKKELEYLYLFSH